MTCRLDGVGADGEGTDPPADVDEGAEGDADVESRVGRAVDVDEGAGLLPATLVSDGRSPAFQARTNAPTPTAEAATAVSGLTR
ncbi:MAG TPA: hypothetical protein VIG79_06660 [Lapillicoccus sp.]|uniref:hypothetical protein n=1 Tax=Lapillicoccus sp. TaxID=1909287 RepID=UPI002F92CE46